MSNFSKSSHIGLKFVLATTLGILIGGSTASVENAACLKEQVPSVTCLTQTPRVRTVQGMIGGVFACAGSFFAIDFGAKQFKR